jgi:hypothetical protein
MKQQKLIDTINELFPKANAVPMEEWDGSDEGIWFPGSEEVHSDDLPIFDFYGFGCHPEINSILTNAGWFYEPHDAGTMMAYPL